MQWNQIDDENISTPRRHHVKVRQRTPSGPVDTTGLDSLDPQVVGEHECEDGDTLVVIAAGHRAGNVSGDNGDEAGGEQTGALRPKLGRQQVRRNGSQTTEINAFF